MMRYSVLPIILLIVSLQAVASLLPIEAIGLQNTQFINATANTNVCYLDVYQALINQINKQIPSRNAIYLADLKHKYQIQFKLISQSELCRYQAKALGITKIPAVIIDHHYVVYGQTNIQFAIADYKQYIQRGAS